MSSSRICVAVVVFLMLAGASFADTPAAAGAVRPRVAAAAELGLFESDCDVGAVKHPGDAEYDSTSGSYTVRGSGANMWFGEDQFHFVWKKMSGNFILSADVALVGAGVDPHRKIGWMIRPDLEIDSPYVDVALHGDGLTSMQYRPSRGADTEQVESELTAPSVLQLERRDGKFILSVARQGDPLASGELSDLKLPDQVYVGLFVCAHNADVVEQAKFTNVRISVPAAGDFRPYRDYIGSRLLVRLIRAADYADYVYIIMLTAKAEKHDIVTGMGAGADDFLAKPFHRDELQVRVRAGVRITKLTYGVLQVKSREFCFTSAGNPPLLHQRAGGSPSMLDVDGFPIGMAPDCDQFAQKSVVLQPGDRLLIYSEGVSDTMNGDGEVFGAAKLLESVKNFSDESLDRMLEGIMDEVKGWRGGAELKSDVSILACEVPPA